MQQILITGAAGFLGQALVNHLIKENSISVVGHGVSKAFTHQKNLTILGEEIEILSLQKMAKNYHQIYHFAGTSSVQVAQNNPTLDFEKSVASTQVLIDYIQRFSPATELIYSSSGAVYGESKDSSPLKETSLLKPISVYGENKAKVEELIINSGVQAKIFRFFSIYGEGLRKQLFWDACQKIAKKDYHFHGPANSYRDWIYIQDALNLIDVTSTHKAAQKVEIYNAGNGEARTIETALNYLFLAFNIDEKPQFNKAHKAGDPLGVYADISRVQNLGYKPSMTLENGLKKYAEWFKQLG